MEALNFIEIETKFGYRAFELLSADITKMPFEVDLIVVSSFSNYYEPLPETVIGALHKQGVNVEKLATTSLFDFREPFGGWVSKEIKDKLFKHILCIEIKGTEFALEESIKNIFTILSVLEFGRLHIKSIALPLIGTGNQQFEATEVIDFLITHSLDYLRHSRYLEKIVFIEHKKEKADELNLAMDEILGRTKVKVPRGPLVDAIKQEILGNIDKILKVADDNQALIDLRRIITTPYTRAFELGGISRKIAELISHDLSPSKKYFDLWKKIDLLANESVAPWIIEYMHILRIFGNEAVHEKSNPNQKPIAIDEKDLELCLFCLQRLLSFYYDFKIKAQ